MGFSPIPLDAFSTWSRFKHLVSGSAIFSFDFTKSIEITPVEINCLTVLCLRRMYRDLPLYITFCALLIIAWLSQHIHNVGTGFGQSGISSKKFRSHSASSPVLSRATNSDSIIDLIIIFYLEDFQDTAPPFKVKKYSLVPFVSCMLDIQLVSEYPFNTAGSLE